MALMRKGGDRPSLLRISGRRHDGSEAHKNSGPIKRFSENAGAVGLLLSLILSFSSLYDIFVRKPEADRIEAIGQFNQAVNNAARVRQELIESNQPGTDAATKLAVSSMATPRILNDVATATAILPTLRDEDVGIPQLIILVDGAMTAGDAVSARKFIERAVNKQGVSPYLASEARRIRGRFLFIMGRHGEGRQEYLRAVELLQSEPSSTAARAFVVADLTAVEFNYGQCESVARHLESLRALLSAEGISIEARAQLASGVRTQLRQYGNGRCPVPAAADLL